MTKTNRYSKLSGRLVWSKEYFNNCLQFSERSNYLPPTSTSTIKSTVTIKFTSIDVSLWLEVWQEMWWAGEGERPTMELKNYKRWSQNINIFYRLFTFRIVISYLWQGMNREGKRRWWSAFAVEVKRRWNPEEKKQTWSTPSREQNVIVFSIYTRKLKTRGKMIKDIIALWDGGGVYEKGDSTLEIILLWEAEERAAVEVGEIQHLRVWKGGVRSWWLWWWWWMGSNPSGSERGEICLWP